MTSLGPPGDEFGSIAPLDRMTNATADFVFVDEANHSPRLKALNRRRVRSQARSTRARFLMQKHKTGQWKTVSTGLRLLAPQEREHGAFLSYDTSCPLTGLTLRRPTLVGSDSKHLAYSNKLSSAE
jgi:hypothetical protein